MHYVAGDIVVDGAALWTSRLTKPSPNQHALIAYDGDDVLGFACAYLDEDPQWSTLLDNLHVRRDAYRRGIGSQLLKAVASHSAKSSANAGLYLWVLQDNIGAQKFYSRHGAKNIEHDVWHAPGGTQVPRFRFAWPESKPSAFK